MRIALVIERFDPRGGGAEGVAWQVAHGLVRAGEEVDVLARVGQVPEAPQVRLRRLPVPRSWQPMRVLAFSAAAHRRARAGSYDLVQSFSRTRHQHIYRAGGGCHAVYMERRYGRLGADLRRLSPRHATLRALERRIFQDPTQCILCNSEMVRREIGQRYAVPPERLAVIPNGVDLERFHPHHHRETAAALRRQLAPEAERVLLLVGSGFRRKGVDTALEVLAELATAGEQGLQLWVAGRDAPGPWRALARRRGVADQVRFLGSRDDLPDLYAAADILLLPTRYDAFANSCLEAAAAGLPVVTSGANGAAEWLGDAGLCVADPEDTQGFANALCELRDPRRRSALGAAARRRAEGASWPEHIRALRALYRRVRG